MKSIGIPAAKFSAPRPVAIKSVSIKTPVTKIAKAVTPAIKGPQFDKSPEVAGIGRPPSRFRAPKESPISPAAHWSGH